MPCVVPPLGGDCFRPLPRSGGARPARESSESLRRRTRDALSRNIEFVRCPRDGSAVPICRQLVCSIDTLYERDRLPADQEAYWFRRMNQLKERADHLRGTLDAVVLDERLLRRVEILLEESLKIRNALLHVFAKLAVSLATRIAGVDDRFDELISEANWTLILAIDKFDPERGFRFSTYATHAIRRNLFRFLSNRRTENARSVGTDSPESLPDDHRNSRYDERQSIDNYRVLQYLVGRLESREQSIIRARFGMNMHQPPLTLRRLSSEFGISRERVRQLEQRALQRLRQMARTEGFEPILA
jgi:RNA polymerase sigma factor (sigma-70 family)